MEYHKPLKYADWTTERREAGFGAESVHAGTEHRDLIIGRLATGAPKHRGMADVVAEDRLVRGFEPTDPGMPVLTTTEIIQAIGKRIDRGRVDPESGRSGIRQQDMGWRGYRAQTVEIEDKQEDGSIIKRVVPNHMRPTNLRQKWAARRMEYAHARHNDYANRALYMRRLYGSRAPVEQLERRPDLPYTARTREDLSGIQPRHPNRKLGIFERLSEFKVDTRLRLIDMRAGMKRRKFDRIASGKWWAI